MDIEQRSATERDADAASLLIRRSFEALAADAWDASARAVFLTETSASALTSAIGTCACARSAFDGGHMVGFLLMKTPASLSLLFVHPSYLGRGIGRMLWESTRSIVEAAFPEVQTIELNATPNSIAFYRRIGFAPISREFQFKGCRATRMACWLPARSLGVEIAP